MAIANRWTEDQWVGVKLSSLKGKNMPHNFKALSMPTDDFKRLAGVPCLMPYLFVFNRIEERFKDLRSSFALFEL
jgi:hypothetical protein